MTEACADAVRIVPQRAAKGQRYLVLEGRGQLAVGMELREESGVVWEERSRLTAHLPVQVANGADLPPMHGQMLRLTEA